MAGNDTVEWEWKDISTAPERGAIIGLVRTSPHDAGIVDLYIGSHNGEKRFYDGQSLDAGTYIRCYPTHWFPYPTHPSDQKKPVDMTEACDLEDEIDRLRKELAEAATERDTYKQRYEHAFADFTRLHDEKMMAKWPECEPKVHAMLADARNKALEEAASLADEAFAIFSKARDRSEAKGKVDAVYIHAGSAGAAKGLSSVIRGLKANPDGGT